MKSFDLAEFPVEKTIQLLTNYLERVIYEADAVRPGYSTFHAQSVPTIDLDDYLARIQKYCPASNECYLAVLVYLHRIIRHNFSNDNPITVDIYSVHRLVIAGIMISSKFFSDIFYTNSRYAKVGGIYVSELNMLEVDLLVALDFNLTIPISELQFYGDNLLNNLLPLSAPSDKEWEVASISSFAIASIESPVYESTKQRMSLDIDTIESHAGWSLTSQTLSPESNPVTPTATSPPASAAKGSHLRKSHTSAHSNSLFPRCVPSSCPSYPTNSTFSQNYDHLY